MMNLTTVMTAIISSLTVILSIWYKDYIQKRSKRLAAVSLQDRSMFYLEMDKICSVIRKSVNAHGSYLAYFHNGGVFSNGISMDKFTVVGEDYIDHTCIGSYKKQYSSMMINYMAYAYHRLLTDNRHVFNVKDDTTDISFKKDLNHRKIVCTHMFLIKDPVSEKPIGFFALEYKEIHENNHINESVIWKHQNKIARLLNMTVIR